MAKLNGVVLTTETIEYNGVLYEKINKDVVGLGNILRVNRLSPTSPYYSRLSEGAYYEVSHFCPLGHLMIIDDWHRSRDADEICGLTDSTLFRKARTVPESSATVPFDDEPDEEPDDEETAKWAAIGRKVGEFKVGDIACDGQQHGIVCDVGISIIWIRCVGGLNPYIRKSDVTYHIPVESILNLPL